MTCARSGAWEILDNWQLAWPTAGHCTWDICDRKNKGKDLPEYLRLVAAMKSPQECVIAAKREAKRRGYELEKAQ